MNAAQPFKLSLIHQFLSSFINRCADHEFSRFDSHCILSMSVNFGFSVGDFIAAIDLVRTVIDALRESGESGAHYGQLLGQLLCLETALLEVKRLEVDDTQHAELITLRQAAAQCQRTIDRFWNKAQRYYPYLASTTGTSGSQIRRGWMKVKWAVFQRDDLVGFSVDLAGHTASIQMLLSTIQM